MPVIEKEVKSVGQQLDEMLKQLNVCQRWNLVLGDLESIEKAGRNADQKYRYMKAADVLKAIRPLLAKYRLILIANPHLSDVEGESSLGLAIEDGEYQTRSGGRAKTVRLRMDYVVINIDDPKDRIELIGIGEASDSSDKALPKARTTAIKYMFRDNFMLDDQDEVEAEDETHERDSHEERRGSAPAPQRTDNVRQLEGVVMEAVAESDTERNWVWFTLNNFAEPLISFQQNLWHLVKPGNRLRVRAVQNRRQGGGMYWRAAEIEVVTAGAAHGDATNDFDRMVPNAGGAPKGESAAEILKRMYPTAKDVKTRRMVEEAIKNQPEDVARAAMASFERRINDEKPSSDLGILSLLDMSIQEAIEAAAIAAEGVPTR